MPMIRCEMCNGKGLIGASGSDKVGYCGVCNGHGKLHQSEKQIKQAKEKAAKEKAETKKVWDKELPVIIFWVATGVAAAIWTQRIDFGVTAKWVASVFAVLTLLVEWRRVILGTIKWVFTLVAIAVAITAIGYYCGRVEINRQADGPVEIKWREKGK